MATQSMAVLGIAASSGVGILGSGLVFLGFLESAAVDAARLPLLSDARFRMESVLTSIRRRVVVLMCLCATTTAVCLLSMVLDWDWAAWPALGLLSASMTLVVSITAQVLAVAAERSRVQGQ